MKNSKLKIQAYAETDKHAVAELWREIFPDAPLWNNPENDIKMKLSVQRELFFVALYENQIVGTAMSGFDGHRGWVYYLAVSAEHRRKGIGSALMQKVEKGLNKLGCTKLNLQVRATNNQVISFYKKLEYEIEERVSMGKRL